MAEVAGSIPVGPTNSHPRFKSQLCVRQRTDTFLPFAYGHGLTH